MGIKNVSFILLFLFLAASGFVITCGKAPHFELSRFLSPEVCGGCHDAIYQQWKNSMHNLSHYDDLYLKLCLNDLKGLTDPEELKEAEHCVLCHTPVGYITGYPLKTSDDLNRVPEIPRQGIQCDYCHSLTGAYKLYNAELKIDPGRGEKDPGVKRGPFKDSKSDYHGSEYSAFHTESKICAACHDVRHVVFGTKLETTYEEWEKGPYNADDDAKRITCQNCHMYQRPGIPATGSTPRPDNPGKASADGPDRPHVFTHYFVGGNSLVPGMYKSGVHGKMAEERLKNAARIAIEDTKIGDGKIVIRLRNTGAGHYIPTGLTHVRQVWLEVVVKNDRGRVIYSTGEAGADGSLPGNAIIYNTIFGDGKGNAVMNVAKAREIIRDKRIPPLGTITEVIAVPGLSGRFLTVEARLLYSLAPQKAVDQLFGKGRLRLPVVVMAEDKKKISL